MITLPFISAWIVMVALGVIGHELGAPQYFVSYAFCLAGSVIGVVIGSLINYMLDNK